MKKQARNLQQIALNKCTDILLHFSDSKKRATRGKDGRYHFVYLTINKNNYMFYVGKHTSSDLNDGYIGSGGKLTKAINDLGVDQFEMCILGFFNTAHEATVSEATVVDQDYLRYYGDELGITYNERPARTSNFEVVKMVDPTNNRLYEVPYKDVKKKIASGWLLKLQTVTITNPKLAHLKDKLPRMAYTKTIHLTTSDRDVYKAHQTLLRYLHEGWIMGTVNSLNPLIVQSPHKNKKR
jgi:hypothetical protein